MKRPERLRQFLNRAPLPSAAVIGWLGVSATAVVAGAALITGVAKNPFRNDGDGIGRDSQAYIASLDPAQRFQHDYAGRDDSGDDCLNLKGYDLYHSGHNQVIKVGDISLRDGIVTITPGEPNKFADPIELTWDAGSEAGSRPLQPANPKSADILSIHGCDFTHY